MSEMSNDIPADRMVSFGASVGLFFKNYFQFNGRSSRGAYWYLMLFLAIASIATAVADLMLFPGDQLSPINTLLSLVTFIPSIALVVRRLHDVGRSGWWYLIIFTIIGIFVILYWIVQPGTRSENKYGPDEEAGRG